MYDYITVYLYYIYILCVSILSEHNPRCLNEFVNELAALPTERGFREYGNINLPGSTDDLGKAFGCKVCGSSCSACSTGSVATRP